MRTPLKATLAVMAVVSTVVLAQTPVTIELVLSLAQALGAFDVETHPYLEKREAGEADSIKKTAQIMFEQQMKGEKQNRDAHAKGHGCVRAEFTVAQNIPANLRSGVFATPGKNFDAIIRYSNGQGKTQADQLPDGRGMAVKLLNAAPDGNLLMTGNTQDFLMINNRNFFVSSMKDYAAFNQIIAEHGSPLLFLATRPFEASIAASILAKPVSSSVMTSYFSMTSYLMKSNRGERSDTAVKFGALPVDCASGRRIVLHGSDSFLDGKDYLRIDLNEKLAEKDRCFDFVAQPLPAGTLEARAKLVEDARLGYGTADVKLATIRIAKQTVDTPARQQYCENLSYNPWQAHPSHKPLGALNRGRKVAVTASSIRRHLVRGTESQEPGSIQEFKDLK